VLEDKLADPAFKDQMVRFVRASMKGWEYALANPDEAAQIVVDNGGLHAFAEASGSISLSEGLHDVRLEYFENAGSAGVVWQWDPAGPTGKQLVPAEVLFRDTRDVLDIVIADPNIVAMVDFTGTVTAIGAHDVTPKIGDGLAAGYYKLAFEPDALSFEAAAASRTKSGVVMSDSPNHSGVTPSMAMPISETSRMREDSMPSSVARIGGRPPLGVLSFMGICSGFPRQS